MNVPQTASEYQLLSSMGVVSRSGRHGFASPRKAASVMKVPARWTVAPAVPWFGPFNVFLRRRRAFLSASSSRRNRSLGWYATASASAGYLLSILLCWSWPETIYAHAKMVPRASERNKLFSCVEMLSIYRRCFPELLPTILSAVHPLAELID